MLKYVLKRILIFFPTMLAMTLIAFSVSINAPGDPVEQMMVGDVPSANVRGTEKAYIDMRKKLGLNLPLFYFSLTSMAEPDTLHKIIRPSDKETMTDMVYKFGNWDAVSDYFYQLKEVDYQLTETKGDSASRMARLQIKNHLSQAKLVSKEQEINYHLDWIDSLVNSNKTALLPVWQSVQDLNTKWDFLKDNRETWKIYVPALRFYGFKNQYHRWLSGMFVGDFGVSYTDKRPISSKIPEALRWTLFINIFALFLAYLISIPIGIHSAVKKDTWQDRTITTVLFVLYSLPTFWVATLLIMFLCNPEYLQLFPSNGVQDTMHSPDWPLMRRISDWAHHLILPTLTYTYTAFAFLSRQMRVGMLEVLGQDYIRTARAKGLREKIVITKHALKNSLIPIVTILGGILPGLVGGSIIIEYIFSIPGMGQTIFAAITSRDYPMIITVFTLVGILTQIGILVSDVLYALMDPRISFEKK